MMKLFHTYKKIFRTELSCAMATEHLLNMIREEDTYKLQKHSTDPCRIEMEVSPEFLLNRNSFLPTVSISICKLADETEVKVCCSLKKGAKVMGIIMLLFLTFMALPMLCLALANQLVNYWILVLPFVIAALVLLLFNAGLTLSSRSVCKSVCTAISSN